MGKLILYAILMGGAGAALLRPWIGVCIAYLFIILTPQAIWWWNFQGVRPVYWILLPTMAGFIIALLQGRLNLETVKNKRNLYLLILWACFILSYFFGAYIGVPSTRWWHDPKWTLTLVFSFNNFFTIH